MQRDFWNCKHLRSEKKLYYFKIQVHGSHIISVITNVSFDKRRNQVTKKSTTSGSTTEAVTKWKAESS